jgi:hypothetical protein
LQEVWGEGAKGRGGELVAVHGAWASRWKGGKSVVCEVVGQSAVEAGYSAAMEMAAFEGAGSALKYASVAVWAAPLGEGVVKWLERGSQKEVWG